MNYVFIPNVISIICHFKIPLGLNTWFIKLKLFFNYDFILYLFFHLFPFHYSWHSEVYCPFSRPLCTTPSPPSSIVLLFWPALSRATNRYHSQFRSCIVLFRYRGVTFLKLLHECFPVLPTLRCVIIPVNLSARNGGLGVGDVVGRAI